MILAFGSRQYFFDVVEAADDTRAKAEACGLEPPAALPGRLEGIETSSQHVVDERLERDAPLPQFPVEPRAHIVVQGQRRAHTLMLWC